MKTYQTVLIAAVLGLTVAGIHRGVGDVFAVIGLAAAAAVAERRRVRLDRSIEISISLLPTVFAAALFGPVAAMIVAACSLITEFPLLTRGVPYLKWGTWTCIRAIYAAVAAFAVTATWPLASSESGHLVVATATAAVVCECLDVAFGALTLKLRGG